MGWPAVDVYSLERLPCTSGGTAPVLIHDFIAWMVSISMPMKPCAVCASHAPPRHAPPPSTVTSGLWLSSARRWTTLYGVDSHGSLRWCTHSSFDPSASHFAFESPGPLRD